MNVQLSRPKGVIISAIASALLGLVFVVFAAISAGGGHGWFSIQIAVVLVLYGLLMIGAAIMLWQRRFWARGPVAAFGLVAGLGFFEYLRDSAWMWLLVAVCLASVAGIVLPSTTTWLRGAHDEPRQPRGPRPDDKRKWWELVGSRLRPRD